MTKNIIEKLNITPDQQDDMELIISSIWRLGRNSIDEADNGRSHLYLKECIEKSNIVIKCTESQDPNSKVLGFLIYYDKNKESYRLSLPIIKNVDDTVIDSYNKYNEQFMFIDDHMKELPYSELVLIAIHPDFQNNGIGNKLLSLLPKQQYKLWTVKETCNAQWYVNKFQLKKEISFDRNIPEIVTYTAQIYVNDKK